MHHAATTGPSELSTIFGYVADIAAAVAVWGLFYARRTVCLAKQAMTDAGADRQATEFNRQAAEADRRHARTDRERHRHRAERDRYRARGRIALGVAQVHL